MEPMITQTWDELVSSGDAQAIIDIEKVILPL